MIWTKEEHDALEDNEELDYLRDCEDKAKREEMANDIILEMLASRRGK